MNRQPNSNSHTIRNLKNTALYVSKKENPISRRIATVLFALFAALVLSACAAPYPFQGTGSVTVLPKEAASGLQINDRQQLAEYQASLPDVSLAASAPKAVKSSGTQINDRQQLAEYQASLSLYTGKMTTAKTIAAVTTVQQIADRQELADYQASLR